MEGLECRIFALYTQIITLFVYSYLVDGHILMDLNYNYKKKSVQHTRQTNIHNNISPVCAAVCGRWDLIVFPRCRMPVFRIHDAEYERLRFVTTEVHHSFSNVYLGVNYYPTLKLKVIVSGSW